MNDDSWAALGVVFMGLGAVAAGLLGIALPEKRRLGALFPPILGAGVGLSILGIGASLRADNEPSGLTFFLGSLGGFLIVCAAAVVVWRRSAEDEPGRAGEPSG
jgi:integral membrane sensor domain MASE1